MLDSLCRESRRCPWANSPLVWTTGRDPAVFSEPEKVRAAAHGRSRSARRGNGDATSYAIRDPGLRKRIMIWSHYANSHQGFCLEFDISKAPFENAHRVRYQRKRALYDLSAVHEKANATNLLLTKYIDWRYEEEWRIIVDKGGATYPFPPEALTGVIFDCHMSEADKIKIKNWINQSPCSPLLYQARLSSRQFRLDIERC